MGEKLTLATLLATFDVAEPKRQRASQPCRIRVGGRFIKTCSGKTLWRDISAAKCALTNHCDSLRYRKGYDRAQIRTLVREALTVVKDATQPQKSPIEIVPV